MYGDGMMPSISTSSANFSGVHLKQIFVGLTAGSRFAMQYILPAMRKSRLCSHWTSSVACGSARQQARTQSIYEDMTGNINGWRLDEQAAWFSQPNSEARARFPLLPPGRRPCASQGARGLLPLGPRSK